jgi:sec-independent protein translocase protein TatA
MLDPVEIIVVGVVVLAIVLWGPAKIPELARALGKAKSEYQKAANEVQRELNTVSEPQKITAAPVNSGFSSAGRKLVEVANDLGISTEGKTFSQIANEIAEVSKTN